MPGAVLPRNPKLTAVLDVVIDENSSIADSERPEDKKTIVRGSARYEFHADIYDALDLMLEDNGLTCQCLGGGKIKHDDSTKTIQVFGKSEGLAAVYQHMAPHYIRKPLKTGDDYSIYFPGYGRANHTLTVDILREKYTEFSITWSED